MLAVAALLLVCLSMVPLPGAGQTLLGMVLLLAGGVCAAARHRGARQLCLLWMAAFAGARCLAWPLWALWTAERSARAASHGAIALGAALLLLAEAPLVLWVALGALVRLWPLDRRPVALPEDPAAWPSVDLVIHRGDRSLEEVQSTALAALEVDWPPRRRRVFLVDPAGASALQHFAQAIGATYLAGEPVLPARDDTDRVPGEACGEPFVAVFTAGHAPVRSFLQMTVGAMVKEPALALLTCAQGQQSEAAVYRQRSRDLWNAVCFNPAGSLLRRAAMEGAGLDVAALMAVAPEVSEALQRRGWTTAFLAMPQVAGAAPDGEPQALKKGHEASTSRDRASRCAGALAGGGRLTLAQRLCGWESRCPAGLAVLWIALASTAPLAIRSRLPVLLPGSLALLLAYLVPHLTLLLLVAVAFGDRGGAARWRQAWGAVRQRARRRSVRRPWQGGARLEGEHGEAVEVSTLDLSLGGARVRSGAAAWASPGALARLVLRGGESLPVTVVAAVGGELHLAFGELTVPERRQLTALLFVPADAWLNGASRVLGRGVRRWSVLWMVMPGLVVLGWALAAGSRPPGEAAHAAAAVRPKPYTQQASFAQLQTHAVERSSADPQVLRVWFAVPHRVLLQAGVLQLQSEGVERAGRYAQLVEVVLNGMPVQQVSLQQVGPAGSTTVALPPEWLVEQNELELRAVRRGDAARKLQRYAAPLRIGAASTVALRGVVLQANGGVLHAGPVRTGVEGQRPRTRIFAGGWSSALVWRTVWCALGVLGLCACGATAMCQLLRALAAVRLGSGTSPESDADLSAYKAGAMW